MSNHANKKWWWLSFSGDEGCLGVSIIRATGMFDAVGKTHRLGINPGGDVAGFEMSGGDISRSERKNLGKDMLIGRAELLSKGYASSDLDAKKTPITEGTAWTSKEGKAMWNETADRIDTLAQEAQRRAELASNGPDFRYWEKKKAWMQRMANEVRNAAWVRAAAEGKDGQA